MSQKPLFVRMNLRSLSLKLSSSSLLDAASEASSFLSITQYTRYERRPMQSRAAPMSMGDDIESNALAMGRLHASAAAVPIRAIATCNPIASASSCPVNHFAIILVTVIPVISAPMPKMANPSAASVTCMGYPQRVDVPKSVSMAYHLSSAPASISAQLITPVKRMPHLSRMIPPKKSISRNTFIYPYAPEKKPYSPLVQPNPPSAGLLVRRSSSGAMMSVMK